MHTDADTIAPLPLRVEPQPWEELAAFLARTARHMQYPRISWLLQPEMLASPMTARNLALLTAQEDYTFLSTLLALSQEQIYAMTLHPFDVLSRHLGCFPPFADSSHQASPPTTIPPRRPPIPRPRLSMQTYQFSCLPANTTQICTHCLQEPVSYDRLYWKVKYLITCPLHRLLLQRSCAGCHHPIFSTRILPLTCQTCHHSFHHDAIPVPEDASFLLQGDLLTLHALGVDLLAPTPISSMLEDDPRYRLPAEQYLALLRALSLSMRPFAVSDFHSLLPAPIAPILTHTQSTSFTPQERLPPLHIATAHWIFAQWPDQFFTFLTALQDQARRSGKKKPPFSFPSLPSTFRSQAPLASSLLSTTRHTRYPL
jgi:hypothetical protein